MVAPTPEDEDALAVVRGLTDVLRAASLPTPDAASSGRALQLARELAPLLPELAGDPAALLPVLLVAADAVWREATGKGFSLDIRRDASALLGYRACGIGAGTFATVMLSTMEAIEQARQPDQLLVNDLIGSVWKAVLDRAGTAAALPPVTAAALPSQIGAPP